MTIRDNIAARDQRTASLLANHPVLRPKVRVTRGQAAEALWGWVYKQPGMATYEDCRDILGRVAAERGLAEAETILQRFGCSFMADLFMGLYVKFFEYTRTVLYYGISPTAAWQTYADIPHEQRDRWLLWHPESSCLWEVRGRLSGELSDGLVEDVSGVKEYEELFITQATRPAVEVEDEL